MRRKLIKLVTFFKIEILKWGQGVEGQNPNPALRLRERILAYFFAQRRMNSYKCYEGSPLDTPCLIVSMVTVG